MTTVEATIESSVESSKPMPEPLKKPGTEEPYEYGSRPYWLAKCSYCGAAPGEYCVMPSGRLRVSSQGGNSKFPHQVRSQWRNSGEWIVALAYDVGSGLVKGDELLVRLSQWSPRFVVVERLSDGYDPHLVLESHEIYYLREKAA